MKVTTNVAMKVIIFKGIELKFVKMLSKEM